MESQSPAPAEVEQSVWTLDHIVNWLFTQGRLINNERLFVSELGHQLIAAVAPVDRLLISSMTLHPLVAAHSATWNRATDVTTPYQANHGVMLSDRYVGSPLQQLFDTQRSVRCNLIDLPADSHSAYSELEALGFTDYFAMPIIYSGGLGSAFIVSTRKLGGFSDFDIELYRELRDYIAPIIEVFALRHTARTLLDTYIGKRTSSKVFAGMVKRGDADVINAALWFSDLRNFTEITEKLPAQETLELLNEYFEFVAAAVTAQGGEILRFIGDAMLIVFPIDQYPSEKNACIAALDAASDAQRTLATQNHIRRRHAKPEIYFGVGLNIGEVVYGNVGAPDRLDFTVMGPAVNRTARLESLTKTVGRNILFSESFAARLDCPTIDLGRHQLKGIAESQAVFAIAEECE